MSSQSSVPGRNAFASINWRRCRVNAPTKASSSKPPTPKAPAMASSSKPPTFNAPTMASSSKPPTFNAPTMASSSKPPTYVPPHLRHKDTAPALPHLSTSFVSPRATSGSQSQSDGPPQKKGRAFGRPTRHETYTVRQSHVNRPWWTDDPQRASMPTGEQSHVSSNMLEEPQPVQPAEPVEPVKPAQPAEPTEKDASTYEKPRQLARRGGRPASSNKHDVPQSPRSCRADWASPTSDDDLRPAPNHWSAEEQTSPLAIHIQDWNGKFAPPPENWDMRPAFGPEADAVQRWLDDLQPSSTIPRSSLVPNLGGTRRCYVLSDACNLKSADPTTEVCLMATIAPLEWYPQQMEALATAGMFWAQHMKAPPRPQDPHDLDTATPWWTNYAHSVVPSLFEYEQPITRGPDPEQESVEETELRQQNLTSQKHIDAGMIKYGKKVAENEQRLKMQAEADKAAKEAQADFDAKAIKSKVPMVIRAAEPKDVQKITTLYNMMVDRAVECADVVHVTKHTVLANIARIHDYGLPYIVAIGPRTGSPPEKLLGVAYATPPGDARKMYRFTTDVEIYVHPKSRRQGVANCLMDQLLSLLDETHPVRRGYKIKGPEMHNGPVRMLGSVQLRMPIDEAEKAQAGRVWKDGWLKKHGFELAGELRNIGVKDEKTVGLLIWNKRTGTKIDPSTVPVMME